MNICLLLLKDWLVWTRSLSSRTIWTWQGKCERWPNSWLLREIKWFILGYRSHSATNKTHGINKQIHWLNTCVCECTYFVLHYLFWGLYLYKTGQNIMSENVNGCYWKCMNSSHTQTQPPLSCYMWLQPGTGSSGPPITGRFV